MKLGGLLRVTLKVECNEVWENEYTLTPDQSKPWHAWRPAGLVASVRPRLLVRPSSSGILIGHDLNSISNMGNREAHGVTLSLMLRFTNDCGEFVGPLCEPRMVRAVVVRHEQNPHPSPTGFCSWISSKHYPVA
jgi:hypothetical protein